MAVPVTWRGPIAGLAGRVTPLLAGGHRPGAGTRAGGGPAARGGAAALAGGLPGAVAAAGGGVVPVTSGTVVVVRSQYARFAVTPKLTRPGSGSWSKIVPAVLALQDTPGVVKSVTATGNPAACTALIPAARESPITDGISAG